MDALENYSQSESRALPPHLLSLAQSNAGGSISEIDARMLPDPDGFVPPEAIVGVWDIDEDGVPTGLFHRNSRYGLPIQDDWSRLEGQDNWLGWLPSDPAASVRDALAETIAAQIPGTLIEWVKVVEIPEFLTGGVPQADDVDKIIVRRAALALQFALSVLPPGGRREFLVGCFSWAATGLDKGGERRDRTWFDIGMKISEAAELLKDRALHVDEDA